MAVGHLGLTSIGAEGQGSFPKRSVLRWHDSGLANAELLQHIRDTYPDLDRWHARSQTPMPEEPAHGSDLAGDDALFRWHRISEAVRLSLMTGGEHLRLARTALEAKQVYPTAHFTVLRGALVGAAQAVWGLSVDDTAERRERGLTLIAEMYAQLRKCYEQMGQVPFSGEELATLKGQIIWCDTRIAQVADVRTSRASLNQTQMISNAVDDVYDDAERRVASKHLWRELSADAHVLGWPVFQRSTFAPTAVGADLAVGLTSDKLDDLAEAFLVAHGLLERGGSYSTSAAPREGCTRAASVGGA